MPRTRKKPETRQRQHPVITKTITTPKEYYRLHEYAQLFGLKGICDNVVNHLKHDYSHSPGVKRLGYTVTGVFATVHIHDSRDAHPPELMVVCVEGNLSREEALDAEIETPDDIAERIEILRNLKIEELTRRPINSVYSGCDGPGIRYYGLYDVVS